MATSMSMSMYSGYPKETSVRVNVTFSVTYAANYKTYFELYRESDDRLIDDAWGSTYEQAANSTRNAGYKTFTGLTAGTDYYIVGSLWNADTDTRLSINEPVLYFTTDSAAIVGAPFYAKVILNGNGGQTSGGATTLTYLDSSMTSWETYEYVSVAYNGSGFARSGYALLGFATSRTSTSAPYPTVGSYDVKATSHDESSPTTVTLYAVWKDAANRPENWSWVSSNIAVDRPLNMTAAEWNDFISRVKEFAAYKGVTLNATYINASKATQGTRMLYSQANAAVQLLKQLSPPTSPPSVSSGSVIRASFFTGLAASLNSIA